MTDPSIEGTTVFEMASTPGAEREVMERVASVVCCCLTGEPLERLKTAVAETALNAIEHGNHYRKELPVRVEIKITAAYISVRISDLGGGQFIPDYTTPDLEAKLAGLQTPRGWGMFLIRHMVDEMNIFDEGSQHVVELIFHRETK